MTWICPTCRKKFKHPNQAHSCERVDIKEHFKNKPPEIKSTYEKLIGEMRTFGRMTLNPVKTSIQVKAGATFLSIRPKKDRLEIEFFLAREVTDPPIYKSFRVSKNRVLHCAVLETAKDVDTQIVGWLHEAYDLVRT